MGKWESGGGEAWKEVDEVGGRGARRLEETEMCEANIDASRGVGKSDNDASRCVRDYDALRCKRKNESSRCESSNDVSERESNNDASRCESNNDASRCESDNDVSRCESDNDVSRCESDNDASSFAILYTNAQSLVNKIAELRVIVNVNSPNIIVITELWTNDSISDEYLIVGGYNIIERKDRNDTDKGRGGGILIYVRKDIYAWKEVTNTSFKCGAVKIK